MVASNGESPFQGPIFRGYVKFQGCISYSKWWFFIVMMGFQGGSIDEV